MTIGEAMKEARSKRGVTVAALAEITGISESSIRGFERDIHAPSIHFVEALADALGMSIDEYIGHRVKKEKS